jgi:hypothetical protein
MGLIITPVSRPIFFMLSGHPRYKVTSFYPSRSPQQHSFYTTPSIFTNIVPPKKKKSA